MMVIFGRNVRKSCISSSILFYLFSFSVTTVSSQHLIDNRIMILITFIKLRDFLLSGAYRKMGLVNLRIFNGSLDRKRRSRYTLNGFSITQHTISRSIKLNFISIYLAN